MQKSDALASRELEWRNQEEVQLNKESEHCGRPVPGDPDLHGGLSKRVRKRREGLENVEVARRSPRFMARVLRGSIYLC